jgi:hypothetical protein
MVRRGFYVCVGFVILLLSFRLQNCFAIDRTTADQALNDAANTLASCYVAVADAERAGANVSDLKVRLGLAGGLLSEAYNAYRLGEYDAAYSYATNCSSSINNIVSNATDSKQKAEAAYENDLFSSSAVSSVGLSLLFVFSLFGWRLLKNRYFRRVLKMKPELGGEAQ